MADNTLHTSARRHWLERRFALHSRGGSLRTECLAGITGFLAAALFTGGHSRAAGDWRNG